MANNSGQTFIEIIIVVAVVVVVITSLVASATFSIRLIGYSKLKIQAVQYAKEGIELTRKRRDESWGDFLSMAQPSPRMWCVDKAGIWHQAENDCNINIDDVFVRSIRLSYDPVKQYVSVFVMVSWREGSELRSSKVETILTKWR